ncbi:unnamed protein product [Absidia cylindrospora]
MVPFLMNDRTMSINGANDLQTYLDTQSRLEPLSLSPSSSSSRSTTKRHVHTESTTPCTSLNNKEAKLKALTLRIENNSDDDAEGWHLKHGG